MIYLNLISRYIENFDISAGDTIRYDIRFDIDIESIFRYFRYIDTALIVIVQDFSASNIESSDNQPTETGKMD